MPFGYLASVSILAVCVAVAVRPPRPLRSSPSNRAFWLSYLVNELPFLGCVWLATATLQTWGDLGTPVGLVGMAVALATAAGLAVIVRRALRPRAEVERALDHGLGTGWRRRLRTSPAGDGRGPGSCCGRSRGSSAPAGASQALSHQDSWQGLLSQSLKENLCHGKTPVDSCRGEDPDRDVGARRRADDRRGGPP